MNKKSKTIKWISPSNIALIKYWGKHGDQLPQNASLSMTLKHSLTTTELTYSPAHDGMELRYNFEGKRNFKFEEKVIRYFQKIKADFPFLNDMKFEIHSSNSFPHSTGIASSASSMSALALCLVSLEERQVNIEYTKSEFLRRASSFARLGSGSASRSTYGGWTTWGEISSIETSSNEFATPITFRVNEKFSKMCDAVLLVSTAEKQVSSSFGHSLMDEHPFAEARYKQASENLNNLSVAMQTGDFSTFAEIVENEALTLHSLLMTSSENGILMKPNSLEIINAVRNYRTKTGTEICFTLDAGPNVHLLYQLKDKEEVQQFIETDLLQFCENGKWIDDEIGDGPVRL